MINNKFWASSALFVEKEAENAEEPPLIGTRNDDSLIRELLVRLDDQPVQPTEPPTPPEPPKPVVKPVVSLTPLLSRAESARALGLVLLATVPILAIAAGLRIWEFGQQSAYMDEASYIITGRTLLEHGTIYANALQWTFGSLLYPIVAGWADLQGGLVGARTVSVFFGLVTVLSTILLTLGLFKAHPQSQEQAKGDFALFSRPVLASLLAGLIVAIMPSAIGLSRFATYDATAAGLFTAGCAAFVWARREAIMADQAKVNRAGSIYLLFFAAALFMFVAFLTKYVVAIFFPPLCLIILLSKTGRGKGFLGFILPLSVASAAYLWLFSGDLTRLLQFASTYKDLRSDDWWGIYLFERFDVIILLVLGYWGVRQAFRDMRSGPALLLAGGTILMIAFVQITRADFDYWKHAIYLIVMLAPLVGWLWSDWYWWDRYDLHNPNRVQRWWVKMRATRGGPEREARLNAIEYNLAGRPETERPGSYSLVGVLALGLVAIAVLWSQAAGSQLVSHWPSITPGLAQIQQASRGASTVLVDDSALLYYLYQNVPTDKITTPFFIDYKGESGKATTATGAYRQAVRDQQFSLIILDGGVTPDGKTLAKEARTILQNNTAYAKIFSAPLNSSNLDEAHTLEIYRLLSKDEQVDAARKAASTPPVAAAATATPKATTAAVATTAAATTAAATTAAATPAPTVKATAAATTSVVLTVAPLATATPAATATATPVPTATPTPAPTFPANAVYDFSTGDEGWGVLPATGGLVSGKGVSSNDVYKLDGHPSLRFSPIPTEKLYTVGVSRTGDFRKISLYVFIPADKADTDIRMGMYYFDSKWGWHDDGFQSKITPGVWTQMTVTVPEKTAMQGFGLKVVGFSGTIYINGVTVE